MAFVAITRRQIWSLAASAILTSCAGPMQGRGDDSVLGTIEQLIGGRLGVSLTRFDGTILFGHRPDERFAMCSTFKAVLAALVLERAEDGDVTLDEEIRFGPADLIPYHPAVEANLARGAMTIEELAIAAVQLSDNVAANLLLNRLGGPVAITDFARRHADDVTRLDRMEPDLNENAQGDPRDTTSPLAMSGLMAHLLFGTGLDVETQQTLRDWMTGSKTGADRIRAGVPDRWTVGNKTGTGAPPGLMVSDLAFLISSGGKAAVLSIYVDRPTAKMNDVATAMSKIAQLAVRAIEFG